MPKFPLLLSVALVAVAAPAAAQVNSAPDTPASAAPQSDVRNNDATTSGDTATNVGGQGAQGGEQGQGEIVVTATRRSEALSDVPLAVSAVTAQSLANSGASDIRQLNQLSPSLLVSSTSSEAAAGGARIRGIGTVGDNPGLESSVATFIDGVYRNRAGVGLTELGKVDRIEVLRGPQGTLFGRNASAGLISVITAKPEFKFGGEAELTYGNYNTRRAQAGVTGPLTDELAFRIDGVYYKRNGFLRDLVSGRTINNRDRWLLRGQLLFQPNDQFSVRVIADYSDRKEECCGATYLPATNVTRRTDGTFNFAPSSIAGLERALGGIINDNTYNRVTSITPGADYVGNVRDGGVSAELNAKFGTSTLTSITAYRDWRLRRGQDADFNNLDILKRLSNDAGGGQRQSFKTFTQELRFQGTAFDDKLDFLIGGYFAREILSLRDNLQYGNDYERYANALLISSVLPSALALSPSPTSSSINVPVVQGTIAALRALPAGDPRRASIGLLSALIANPARPGFGSLAAALGQPTLGLNGVGLDDRYRQVSRNYAFFTHNVIRFTDSFNLTLGARYTNERKTLDTTLTDNNALCRAITGSPLQALGALPCVIPSVANGSFTQNGTRLSEGKFTGTAVLSFKPAQGLLTYASYSRGYKAGGFNLDRSGLSGRVVVGTAALGLPATIDTNSLGFAPETVNAFEVGAKLNRPGFDLNVAAFYQLFNNFQLNTFNGVNFFVANISSCKDALDATGACSSGRTRAGVLSKGIELEAFIRPARHLSTNLGFTLADTRYRTRLTGTAGAPLPGALFLLPGNRVSNAPKYVVTGAVTWTPPLGDSGLTGLAYTDFRYQSATNTGSDLFVEKLQPSFTVVNARVGIRGSEGRWGIELFAQNVFNEQYQQVSFNAPLQGSNSRAALGRVPGVTSATQLFGVFLGEPRTYGVTGRLRF